MTCKECQFEPAKFMGIDYTPHSQACSQNKPKSYKEMMDRQFVPDTIEVPVQWLKELVAMVDQSDYELTDEMWRHIDLIREKLI